MNGFLFILFVYFVCFIAGENDLKLIPSKPEHWKALGDALVLSCSSSLFQPSQLLWIDNNNINITQTGSDIIIPRIYIEDGVKSKKLYITNIHGYDSGSYKCRVKDGTKTYEISTTLKTFDAMKFVDIQLYQAFPVEKDGIVRCEVAGNPMPQVSWLLNNTRIYPGGRYSVEKSGLKVKMMTFSDSGTYTCSAEVEQFGHFDQKNIEVAVHVPPKLTNELSHLKGVEGSDFGFSCEASGVPSPTYSFYINENPLINSSRINVDGAAGRVYFAPIERDDQGTITCRAKNDVGEVTTRGQLEVLISPGILSFKNLTVTEGENFVMSCSAEGSPPPQLTIVKHGDPSFIEKHKTIMSTAKENDSLLLRVTEVTKEVSGLYICSATSSVSSTEANAVIVVQYKPRPVPDQPTVAYTWGNQTRNISCSVDSYPAPTFKWFLFRKQLQDNDTYRIFNVNQTSYLQVYVKINMQGWIYNNFVCRATNVAGSVDIPIKLDRAALPNLPRHVEVVHAYPTEIKLKVELPDDDGGMPIIQYKVHYNGEFQVFSVDDEVRIRHLKPGTQFELKVQARNEVGFGTGFDLEVATESIRSPYPINITSPVNSSQFYSYETTWQEPIDVGEPIEMYRIKYRKVRMDSNGNVEGPLEDWIKLDIYDLKLGSTLKGLDHNSYYQLEAYARNKIGWSDVPKFFLFRTRTDPYPTTTTTSTTTTTIIITVATSSLANHSGGIGYDYEDKDGLHNMSLKLQEDPNQHASSTSSGSQRSIASIVVPVLFVLLIIFFIIVDILCFFVKGWSAIVHLCLCLFGRGFKINDNNNRKLLNNEHVRMEKESLNGNISANGGSAAVMMEAQDDSFHRQALVSSVPSQTSSNKSE